MKKSVLIIAVLFMLGITACSNEKEEKLRDIEYTVTSQDEVPQEVRDVIEQKRKEKMQFTYQTQEYLYVIKGYGTLPASGYSIQAKDFYLTKDHMVFSTILQGPGEGQQVEEKETYPVIIVKTENLDKNVVFK